MEAASIPAQRAGRSSAGAAVRDFMQRYGLIALLVGPVVYLAIHDLAGPGNLTHLAENLKDGVSNGAIWALVAIGYTLVYGIIELINFAHGDVFMLGSFTAFAFWSSIGLSLGSSGFGLAGGLLLTLIVSMLA